MGKNNISGLPKTIVLISCAEKCLRMFFHKHFAFFSCLPLVHSVAETYAGKKITINHPDSESSGSLSY
jgi:hypothetical protein